MHQNQMVDKDWPKSYTYQDYMVILTHSKLINTMQRKWALYYNLKIRMKENLIAQKEPGEYTEIKRHLTQWTDRVPGG